MAVSGKIFTLVIGALGAPLAQAAVFTVTDSGDAATGSSTCDGSVACTLRQAMNAANAAAGTNTIAFAIPGSGPHTIAVLNSALPNITSNLTIDGFSQPGTQANTNAPDQGGLNAQLMIEINGSNITAFSVEAFAVGKSVNVTLQGLAINGFGSDAITGYPGGSGLGGGHTLSVYGCYIGTQLDGSAYAGGFGNNGTAIRSGGGGDSAQIGGALPWQRDLISGNRGGGILADGPVTIEGNMIGPDAGGTVAIGGGAGSNWPGIYVAADAPIVIGCSGSGCSNAASRNVISGYHEYGIGVWSKASTLQIKGNYIGTDWTGTQPIPNGDATGGCPTYCGGIQLQNGVSNPTAIIGGFNPGEANLIAFNNGPGIMAWSGNFDSRANAIHNNRAPVNIALRQYLSPEPLANDTGDADAGNNNQQNYPVIQSASVSGTPGNLSLNVTYLVDSAIANTTYPLRVDFYVAVDEGSGRYLVSDSYNSANAQWPVSVALALPANVSALVGFVVTATDANGYTSEFSPSYVFDRIFADGFGH